MNRNDSRKCKRSGRGERKEQNRKETQTGRTRRMKEIKIDRRIGMKDEKQKL